MIINVFKQIESYICCSSEFRSISFFSQENVDNILPTYNSLLMYYDGTKQWDAAYKTAMVSLATNSY